MSRIDPRQTSAERAIALARSVAGLLRAGGWRVQEGMRYTCGVLDLVADRDAARRLISIDAGGGEVAFSESEPFDAAPLAFRLGDDTPLQARALADAGLGAIVQKMAYRRGKSVSTTKRKNVPRAASYASLFRATNPEFARTIHNALHAIDAVYDDLLHSAIETLRDDLLLLSEEDARELLKPMVERVTSLHGIVITDATLWAIGDRRRSVKHVRLAQSAIGENDPRWIDIVHESAIAQFFGK
jgi:hypothetical protein